MRNPSHISYKIHKRMFKGVGISLILSTQQGICEVNHFMTCRGALINSKAISTKTVTQMQHGHMQLSSIPTIQTRIPTSETRNARRAKGNPRRKPRGLHSQSPSPICSTIPNLLQCWWSGCEYQSFLVSDVIKTNQDLSIITQKKKGT